MKTEHVAGIIVAGGRSSRMRMPKASISIDGGPALTKLLSVYLRAGIAPTVVVIDEDQFDVAPDPGAIIVQSDPQAEMIDSVARGIAALPASAVGAVIQPVDAPFTTVEVLHRLLDGAASIPRCASFEGALGHPIYVPRARFFAEILRRPAGGLRRVAPDPERVECDDRRVLADLDTPEDLRAWTQGEQS